MRINGAPAPSELAKYATISDGIGPHRHDGLDYHEHGDPTYSSAEVKFFEARGWHVDNHHGRVYDASGGQVTPFHVGAALQQARRQGLLDAVTAPDGTVAKMVSGPGELPPVVEHLDLRRQALVHPDSRETIS